MATLVRARPKAIEYLPEWAKCCAGMLEQSRRRAEQLAEITLDLSQNTTYTNWTCPHCGRVEPSPLAAAAVVGIPGKATVINWLDLDEGTYVAGEPSEGGAE